MWEKLLELFKETQGNENEVVPASIAKKEARRQELTRQELARQVIQPQESVQETGESKGPATLIGYNYLKGLEDEQNNEHKRRFANLSKLLRGDYKDGKIEAINAEPERDLRRKNSE